MTKSSQLAVLLTSGEGSRIASSSPAPAARMADAAMPQRKQLRPQEQDGCEHLAFVLLRKSPLQRSGICFRRDARIDNRTRFRNSPDYCMYGPIIGSTMTGNRRPQKPTGPKESSQTLARGLKLLQAVADGGEGVAVRELARAAALPRSIVQRLLHTLEVEGFLEKHPSQVGYRLTIKLWGLGCASIRRLSVRDVARPHLEELARRTSEMTKLGVLDGNEVVYIDRVECPQAVRAYVPIGGRAPAHLAATGKAMLAFLPLDARDAMARAAQTSDGGNAKTLLAEFERIRRRGYAINRGEWEQSVGAMAAPVFDAQGEVIASIGIILPAHRLSAARAAQMGPWIAASAAEISRQLGHNAGRSTAAMKRAG